MDAAETLRKSRFFLQCALDTPPKESWQAASLLEAAIVFARSVTLHLQKQLAHRPGFTAWYETQRQRLEESKVAGFLVDQRNISLKVKPLHTRRVINVVMSDAVGVDMLQSEAQTRQDALFFDEDGWRDTPAMDIVANHLNLLAEIVEEAMRAFSNNSAGAA